MSWKDAFSRVPEGESAGQAPRNLRVWTSQTLNGFLGGLLFGGYRGLVLARDERNSSPVPVRTRYERAAVFFVQEGVFTGARVGLFVSAVSAFALLAQSMRGTDDPLNLATAGALVTGAFGAANAGKMAFAPAAGFGALAAGLLGSVEYGLRSFTGTDPFAAVGRQVEEEGERLSVQKVVDQLEQGVKDRVQGGLISSSGKNFEDGKEKRSDA